MSPPTEAKIKALKVPQLKELLQKAAVPFPAKASKAELVKKVLESQAALASVNGDITPPAAPSSAPSLDVKPTEAEDEDNDLLAPPPVFDWGADNPTTSSKSTTATVPAPVVANPPSTKSAPTSPPKPGITKTAPATVPTATATTTTTTTTPAAAPTADSQAVLDAEVAKRKARAARFGMEYVEPKKPGSPAKPTTAAKAPAAKTVTPQNKGPAATKPPIDDPALLKARAERFKAATVVPPPKNNTAPNPSSATAVDEAELERRKKRKERFEKDEAARLAALASEPATKKARITS